MINILSVVGARPNFMKVAPIHRAFQKYSGRISHSIVHTGQHYDKRMSDAFFKDLDMPHPAYFMGVGSGSHAEQTAKVMTEFEKVCVQTHPDFVIVVGDVNSTVACALTAVKLGIKTAHVEAGLRSFDRNMPEEINRMATDAIVDYCFVTEQSGFDNLIKQNFPKDHIFFVGNTMIDSLLFALEKSKHSDILSRLNIQSEKYTLITLHRPSNVDDKKQLEMFLTLFNDVCDKRQIVFPIHPRTRKNIELFKLNHLIQNKNIILSEPLGYIDFLCLMQNADFVMTDSGGIQEETTYLKKTCLTLRTTTERPITTQIGTNILINPDFNSIENELNKVLSGEKRIGTIPELWDGKASNRITDIIANKIFA